MLKSNFLKASHRQRQPFSTRGPGGGTCSGSSRSPTLETTLALLDRCVQGWGFSPLGTPAERRDTLGDPRGVLSSPMLQTTLALLARCVQGRRFSPSGPSRRDGTLEDPRG